MENMLLAAGIAALIGAIVGGGLKVADVEVPVLTSWRRQALLAALGVIFVVLAFHQSLWAALIPSKSVPGPGGVVTSEAHPTSGFGFIYLGMRDGSGWVNNRFAYGPIISVDTVPKNGDEVTIVQPVHLRENIPSANDPLVMSNDLGILEVGTRVRIKTVTKIIPDGYYWSGVNVLGP